jgi:hypothetical protein
MQPDIASTSVLGCIASPRFLLAILQFLLDRLRGQMYSNSEMELLTRARCGGPGKRINRLSSNETREKEITIVHDVKRTLLKKATYVRAKQSQDVRR